MNLKPLQEKIYKIVSLSGYAFGGIKKQREILVKEGIKFDHRRIDLKKYFFSCIVD